MKMESSKIKLNENIPLIKKKEKNFEIFKNDAS